MKSVFTVLIFLQFLPFSGSAQSNHLFTQRFDVAPLSILEYNLNIKCSNDKLKAFAYLRFYDADGHKLLEYKTGPVSSVTWEKTGDYTEAPPDAKYATVTVEKDTAEPGEISVDGFSLDLNMGTPVNRHRPLCNLDEYMRPFWNADTIFNETVLLYSVKGSAATGKLLFTPDKILSVRSFDLATTYTEKKDYVLKGRTITRRFHSAMPFKRDSSFDRQDLAWYNLQSQWVVVTYTHKDKWNGPCPVYQGERMPEIMTKLRSRSPVCIVAYGMSITRGLNTSGYDTVAPHMPDYIDLFTGALKKMYGYSDIRSFNAGLPGSLASWGATYTDQYVNPLIPDLVIIDFGMNDFWRYTPEEFRDYIKTIIRKVQTVNPHVEFLLLSNMKFDPDYISDTDKNKSFYIRNMEGYAKVLGQLETTGIINLDMTTLSGYIYSRKKAKDCIANPLHPNDYMARWYAQGMAALFRE